MVKKEAWDTDFYATKGELERFFRALLCVGGHFTSSMSFAPIDKPTRDVSVFIRVWIPKGMEQTFQELTKVRLKSPPKVRV